MSTVIVLGTLGDLIKKTCELELLSEDQHNRDTIVQLNAYYKILEQWPVEDKVKTETLCNSIKIQFGKHLHLEEEIIKIRKEKPESTDFRNFDRLSSWYVQFCRLSEMYLESIMLLRNMINKLNEQGQHLGLPPFSLNIEEGSDDNSSADDSAKSS